MNHAAPSVRENFPPVRRAARVRHEKPSKPGSTQQHFWGGMGAQHQFRELFEHLPDVYFYFKDARSRMMGASHHILERFGLARETDIIGASDYDFFPAHVADAYVRDDQRVMSSGEPLVDYLEVWYTEQRLLDWYISTKLPVYDEAGSVIGVMGTLRAYEGQRRSSHSMTEIDGVVEFIRHHHRQHITVSHLAEMARLSPRQLQRRFTEVFGLTVHDFLAKTRIQAACETLLKTDKSMAQIAADHGFCDQSAFAQQFKRHIGETPLRFRRKHAP